MLADWCSQGVHWGDTFGWTLRERPWNDELEDNTELNQNGNIRVDTYREQIATGGPRSNLPR